MSVKRIHAVPPPALPPHAVPLYGLPTSDVVYAVNSLTILEGGISLGIPAIIDSEYDIDLRPDAQGKPRDRLGFRFTVKNQSGNPEATITDFNIEDNIYLFDAFDSSDDPTGDIIPDGSEFDLVFFTSFGIESLNQGVNNLSGEWMIGNTFAGFPGISEEYFITINYTVIIPYVNDNGKTPLSSSGRIAPHAYIDEYTILNKRENDNPR